MASVSFSIMAPPSEHWKIDVRLQPIEIITNMTTAILERLDPAIRAVIDDPEKTQQTAAIGTLF